MHTYQWLFASIVAQTSSSLPAVTVTLVDAHHCPGAAQILFALPDGRRVVHTGDMRFDPSMLSDPLIESFRGADFLFLDTTYACFRAGSFPPQRECIDAIADAVASLDDPGNSTNSNHNTLFLLATYGLGKEKVLEAVRDRTGKRVMVSERRMRVMGCIW